MWRLFFLAALCCCCSGAGGVASLKDDTCSTTSESEQLGESCLDDLVLVTHWCKDIQVHTHRTSCIMRKFIHSERKKVTHEYICVLQPHLPSWCFAHISIHHFSTHCGGGQPQFSLQFEAPKTKVHNPSLKILEMQTPCFRWFRAEDHYHQLVADARGLAERVNQVYSVLDLFGASKRVARTWERENYCAIGFDIKICSTHDLCSRMGFKILLTMGMQ